MINKKRHGWGRNINGYSTYLGWFKDNQRHGNNYYLEDKGMDKT